MAKGKKTGGGSRKGVPNKATAEVKTLAQQYTAQVIEGLATLAGLVNGGDGMAESEQARVAAMKELLDRGHGRPMQSMDVKITRISDLSDDELAAQLAELEPARSGGALPGNAGSGGQQTRH